jgi:hypothetical protein
MAQALKARLAAKLSPAKVRVSPMFHAILACLLGQTGWSRPELAAVTVTNDGFLLGMAEGDVGFNHFLGAKADLDDNLSGLADAMGLTPKEKKFLLGLSPAFRL